MFWEQVPAIYVVQHNGTDEGTWQYQVKCGNLPVAIIIGSTVGAFFAICLAFVISAVVVININDWRQYQNYLKNKEATVQDLPLESINPLFKDPWKRNPSYKRSAKKSTRKSN